MLLTAAGLALEAERLFPKAHPFAAWLERASTSEAARAQLADLFRTAPAAARDSLAIVVDSAGRVVSYADEKVVLKARKDR